MDFQINSAKLSYLNKTDDEQITLIQQFYLPSNQGRQEEIKGCLKRNVENSSINRIYLLNERIYSSQELGVESDKIFQTDIGKRLLFQDIFDFVERSELKGYIIISNSDIVFDKTLEKLRQSDLREQPTLIALSRFEKDSYTEELTVKDDILECWSQDSWIYHSQYNPTQDKRKVFNFSLGTLGCDNKICYLFALLGYRLCNDNLSITTEHVHQIDYRSYAEENRLKRPYLFLHSTKTPKINLNVPSTFDEENESLYHYLNEKISGKKEFFLPLFSDMETNLTNSVISSKKDQLSLPEKLLLNIKATKGIKISSNEKAVLFAQKYIKAFRSSDLCLSWDNRDRVYLSIKTAQKTILKHIKTKRIWRHVLDIFHYRYYRPWTLALKGKRLLIISKANDLIRQQLVNRERLYGFDFFPDCQFVFLKPPQTDSNHDSRDFDIELADFVQKIRQIRHSFDVALCSCGGYENLICPEIFKMGRSAISVGDVLHMYFGIIGTKWEEETPEIINLYKNKYWIQLE